MKMQVTRETVESWLESRDYRRDISFPNRWMQNYTQNVLVVRDDCVLAVDGEVLDYGPDTEYREFMRRMEDMNNKYRHPSCNR